MRASGGLEPIDPGVPGVPGVHKHGDSASLGVDDPERPDGHMGPADLSAGACADCHEAHYRDWQTSRHAMAWSNGIFQREFKQSPKTWCVHCHAPLTPQVEAYRAGRSGLVDRADRADRADLINEGVNCAACHIRAGRIVARERSPDSPHDTLIAADFGSPAFCGDCHQFNFPVFDHDGRAVRSSPHPMQATVSQFLAAKRAGQLPRLPDSAPGASGELPTSCLDCHAQGESGHAFRGAHEPAMLTRALAFSVCRRADTAVIDVENRGAGHNVPTGDIHRHLTVRAWRSSAPERLFDAFIGRRFSPDQAGGKRTTWDSTLAPGAHKRYQIELAKLGGEPDEPIAFELRYVYLRDEHPRHDPGEPSFHVVSELRLPAAEMTPCQP